MGYRLYIETVDGKEVWCGGKLYGYEYDKDIHFHGFLELLKTSGDACADLFCHLSCYEITAFEFMKSVLRYKPDFSSAIRSFFQSHQVIVYTLTKEKTARFIGRYLLDFMASHGRQAAFEMKGRVPELTEDYYIIKWF